jgi:hypothetical protein
LQEKQKESELEQNTPSRNRIGFKTTANAKVGTDHHRQLLSTKDWYFSELHRRILTQHYQKQELEIPADT